MWTRFRCGHFRVACHKTQQHLRWFRSEKPPAAGLHPLAFLACMGGACAGLSFSSMLDDVTHFVQFQSFQSFHLGFSTALPGSSLGAMAATVASTSPQRLQSFNAIVEAAPCGHHFSTISRSAMFGARVGLRTAWHLWLLLASNASGAILGAMSISSDSVMLAMFLPFVSFSLLAAMMIPAFWAFGCFGAAGLVTGTVGGAALASGTAVTAARLSARQAAVRSAMVFGTLASPVVVATSVACGLAPNVLDMLPEGFDNGRPGGQIDWQSKRARFREV